MLLTIAIPSHNGSRFIEKAIYSVWKQTRSLDEVEILIVDNASTDETWKILQLLCKRGVDLNLVKNKEILPPDENYRRAVEKSLGEYVWLLADDDELVEGSVEIMLKVIAETNSNVVCANFIRIDEFGEKLDVRSSAYPDEHYLSAKKAECRVFHGANSFRQIGFEKIGLLSANCFRRESYLKESGKESIPDGFGWMYAIACMMLEGSSSFIGAPLVLFRQYRKRWETSTDLTDSLKIDFLVIPVILKKLRMRGYPRRFIHRLQLERSFTFLWHLNQAKLLGFRPSASFVYKFIRVNKLNPILMLQLPLLFSNVRLLSNFARIYNSKFKRSLKKLI